jgi:hypothetical protein
MLREAIRPVVILFILLAFLCPPAPGAGNKTAYTRDGVHFVSKERMEENIFYEYARPGDYREVLVPSDTIVVGASVIPQLAEEEHLAQESKGMPGDEKEGAGGSSNKREGSSKEGEDATKYPYAAIGIGLLLVCGLVASLAWVRSRKSRRRRRSPRRR